MRLNFFKKSIGKIIKEQGENYCKQYNTLGIGEGLKVKDGNLTKEKAVVFFVKHKFPETKLLSSEKIPKTISGQLTDVIETNGEIEPMARLKHRPIVGGTSAKVFGGTACTLGLIAFKNGKPVALTNEHCLMYPSGKDNFGNSYIQPSPADGGKTNDSIGDITSKPTIKNDQTNKIDSAIVSLDVPFELEVRKISNYTKQWKDPQVGMRFRKPSRTTDYTEGVISHINVLAKVNYKGDLGVAQFYPCIFALQNNYDIVDGGDSGSCIFDEQGNVIGQTFAASPSLAIFLPFRSIIEELGIELDKKEPIEGYIAINQSWSTDKEILINGLNFRKEPRIADNIIRKLNRGEKIQILKYAGFNDGWHWIKITC